MAYTPIPDEELEPGKPGSSELFFKLRDNPEGIAAGDPGAPKRQEGAIEDGVIRKTYSGKVFSGDGTVTSSDPIVNAWTRAGV